MVREEKEKIILDNNVAVDPISGISCPKCKTNLDHSELCENCKKNQYPFKSVIALGYYFPRWARKRDTMISPDVRKYRLNNINPEYLFSELINYAKGRSKKSKTKRLEIIKILCKGLAWKLKKDCFNILNKIDFIVHVPKYNEIKNIKSFNHGIYYADFLSKELDIPFERYLLIQKALNQPISIASNPEKIKGSTIMIVDDIFTKGETKGPICRLLSENGAKEIYIGVIGRTLDLKASYLPKTAEKEFKNEISHLSEDSKDLISEIKPFNKINENNIKNESILSELNNKVRNRQDLQVSLITTENIMKSLSDEWQSLKDLSFKLNIKDELDIRFLKIKLKGFEKKGFIKIDLIDEEKYWKKH